MRPERGGKNPAGTCDLKTERIYARRQMTTHPSKFLSGYNTQEVSADMKELSFSLSKLGENTQAVGEVVVVVTGHDEKSDLTGWLQHEAGKLVETSRW